MTDDKYKIDNTWKELLNTNQVHAVETVDGPVLVVAGAGSGKTRVLTYRYAHLVQKHNVDTDSILAITFTKKAAGEMKERISELLSLSRPPIWVTTFHSACAKILRKHISRIGFNNSFSIYDSQDSVRLVSNCLKELDMDTKQYPPKRIHSQISMWKNKLILPGEIIDEASSFYETKIAEVYVKYEQKLILSNSLDFDDLLIKTVELFNTDDDALSFWSKKFKYIMVDEYQDTNFPQYKIIEMLSREHKNICVVGDSDQSIYAFRGADIRNIDEFDKDFSNAKTIVLDRNYRSTQKILDAANSVISVNKNRKSKNLWTDRTDGPEINSIKFNNENDETQWIINEINKNFKKENFGEIAIFYRMNSQSRIIQEALTRERISYKVIGDVRFYERKEIKDIIAYLTLIVNPDNEVAFERIVNVPRRGIGNVTIEKLKNLALQLNIPISRLIYRIDELDELSERVKKQLTNFQEILIGIKSESIDGPAKAIKSMLEITNYEEMLKQEIDYESRWENVQSLITGATEFELEVERDELDTEDPYSMLNAYLENLSLFAATDELENENRIILMTLHNAKGLEFETVFIIGMEENIFPHELSQDDVEEERRLCYVGMTRAKDRLYLTHSWSRSSWGGTFYNPPSRFLEEAKGFITDIDKTDYSQFKDNDEENSSYGIGRTVIHEAYGKGVIIEVDGSEVSVDFGKEIGVKHFDTEWAPIQFE